MPSEKFQEQEKKNQEEVEKRREAKATEENEQSSVFWHQVKEGQIANLEYEHFHEKTGRVTMERPLRFYEHTFETSDPKKITHIEESDSFRTGLIIFCGHGSEGRRIASEKTMAHNAKKEQRVYTSEVVTTSPTVTDMRDVPAEPEPMG